MAFKILCIVPIVAMVACKQCTDAAPSFLKFRPYPRVIAKQLQYRKTQAPQGDFLHLNPDAGVVRGGESSEEDNNNIAQDILLKLFALNTGINGVGLGFFPTLLNKYLYQVDLEKDSLDAYCCTAIGCQFLDYGLTGYLAATGLTSVEKAIGYGMLPDLIFIGKDLIDGTFKKFHIRTAMSAAFCVLSVGAYSLIRESPKSLLFAKVLSFLPLVKDMYVYVDPVGAANHTLEADLSETAHTAATYRCSGQYQIITSFLRGALAFGVMPVKALGYTLILNVVSLADTVFLRKQHKDWGNSSMNSIVYMAIAAAGAIACLRD